MSEFINLPVKPAPRYTPATINAYAPGEGWDAKPSISTINIIHKPAFILVANYAKAGKTFSNHTAYLTDKFILQSMVENRTEKVQILETFGEQAAISFFNSKTKIYQISGTLLEGTYSNESPNYYKWASSFKDLYEKHMRGTQLARTGKIAVLTVMDNMIYFYPINLNIGSVSASPVSASFSMNIIVVDHISTIGRELENQYSFKLNLEERLGIEEAKKEKEDADKQRWYVSVSIVGDTPPTNAEIGEALGTLRGKEAKLESLIASNTSLLEKYGRILLGNKDDEALEGSILLETQNAKDGALKAEQKAKNLILKDYGL